MPPVYLAVISMYLISNCFCLEMISKGFISLSMLGNLVLYKEVILCGGCLGIGFGSGLVVRVAFFFILNGLF